MAKYQLRQTGAEIQGALDKLTNNTATSGQPLVADGSNGVTFGNVSQDKLTLSSVPEETGAMDYVLGFKNGNVVRSEPGSSQITRDQQTFYSFGDLASYINQHRLEIVSVAINGNIRSFDIATKGIKFNVLGTSVEGVMIAKNALEDTGGNFSVLYERGWPDVANIMLYTKVGYAEYTWVITERHYPSGPNQPYSGGVAAGTLICNYEQYNESDNYFYTTSGQTTFNNLQNIYFIFDLKTTS